MSLTLTDANGREHQVSLNATNQLSGRRRQLTLTPAQLTAWALLHRSVTINLPVAKGEFNANSLAAQLADVLNWTIPNKQQVVGQFTLRGFDATTGVTAVDVSRNDSDFVFSTLLKDTHTPEYARVPVAKVATVHGELFAIDFSDKLRVAIPMSALHTD
ncbi:hypothetical protein [Lacticaseibacillus brantae]|uniref:Uncharacterized protein n=1 Tax=Lacticaseibacillus brantae DSM 23927 TaxID=1423727 RepID=A0A0R2AZR9_9LACO|nr:hypothetical protein [Lacticaseibacillus brantae]KRM72034.1 hypothetical protein FC34_GL001017 [Lacticaseibacillus brantae DSM 23927]